ncbi:MAG: maleate cis-trans isomerase [Geminicoccaceae bacterium]
MYGWRGRIGLLVPTGNTVMEPEFQKWAPEGVSVHANRVYLEDVTPDALLAMERETGMAAEGLRTCEVGVIAFGCTSGSFVGGPGYDRRLQMSIETATGISAITTTTAVLNAISSFGVSRIAMATPYTDEINRIEADFLAAQGIEVTAMAGGGLTETATIQRLEPSIAYKRAREVDNPAAELLFISCTGFRTAEIINALEADTGKPVVSANQATFWACLDLLHVGEKPQNAGRLLRAQQLRRTDPS